ncbi:sugar ABC transporter substrate-binding protein [Microbacterium sp. ISL-59]|uniref:ABC transporter substrate-binding protein n=1 Tax=Microbacterium sp. ISL-59 TaxID=2819159 RepID=UPI001BE749E2|nr:sugar ABC transporter substrate-binding protein [Microbacterium sp. ISL-59]MBT2496727.1 sugar ABC transporter substrate-binding protein [Microbacterium sp. ISL-59]
MWGNESDFAIWEQVIDDFEATHPDITVKFEPMEYGAFWTKVNTQLASNSAPDVIGMQFQSAELGRAGQLEPLDNLSADFDLIPENLLDVGQTEIDGETTTFALPWHFVGGTLYANTTAMEEAGIEVPREDWTIDEFVDAAKAMTKDGQYGFTVPLGGSAVALASAFGAQPVSDDGTTAMFDTEEMIEYKTWLRDLIYVDKVAPRPADLSTTKDPFAVGTVAMKLDGTWLIPGFRDIQDFDWDIVANPVGKSEPKNYAGPDSISVTAASKKKEAALEFVQYVVFDPAAQEVISATGASVLADLISDPASIERESQAGPSNYKYFVERATENGTGWAFVPKFNEIVAAEMTGDYQIFESADSDVEAILKGVDKDVQAYLDSGK